MSNTWNKDETVDFTGQSHVTAVIANQLNWNYINSNVENLTLAKKLQCIALQLENEDLNNANIYTDGSLYTNHTSLTGQVVVEAGWVIELPHSNSQITF